MTGVFSTQDISATRCSELADLGQAVVDAELDIVLPSYKPKCSPKILSQAQKVC